MAIVDIIELVKPETGEKFYPYAHISGVKGAELLPRIGGSVQTTLPTPIFQIKDALNAQFYPQTHAEAVIGLAQTIESNQFFVKESDGNGGYRIKLKDEFTGFYANGWAAAGGVGTGGGGGGGLIGTVYGESSLGTIYSTGGTENLTETFSAFAIDKIWQSVLALQQSTPNVSLVNGQEYSSISINGASAQFYTKSQVDGLVSGIHSFEPVPVLSLPAASADTMYKLYLVPSEDPQSQNIKDEYITYRTGSAGDYTYSWEKVGSTAIDLTGYATESWVNQQGFLKTETDPTVPAWAKEQSKPSYSLSEISGADDLRAIEALAGTAGLLKKTAADTWALDTNPYVYEVDTQGDGFLDFVHNDGNITRIDLNHEHSNYVPITRTVNGTPLSQDISITAQGLGVASWAMGSGSGSTIPASVLPSLFVARTPVSDTAANATLLGVDAISNASASDANDTSRFAWDSVSGAWHFLGNLYVDGFLAGGGIGSGGGGGYGVEEITSNEDGTVDFHFTGGDVTTVDLNHEHPQYASKMAETSQPSGGFLPDVVYELGTLTGSVTFALASAVSGQVNHYFWTFDTGSTAPTISAWPSGVAWKDGSAPSVSANKHYEISVLKGIGLYMEV